jgi:hypothetical protein
MRIGERVVVLEDVIVLGSFGAELITRGSRGVVTELHEDQAGIKTNHDEYWLPLASIAIEDANAA